MYTRHAGQRQKIYVDNLQTFLLISMVQLSNAAYNFGMEWESEDVNVVTEVDIEGTRNDQEVKEGVFRDSYSICAPVNVLTVNQSYIALGSD